MNFFTKKPELDMTPVLPKPRVPNVLAIFLAAALAAGLVLIELCSKGHGFP